MKIAIKASLSDAGEWVLDVLGVPFGSRAQKDTHGQYFSRSTQLHEDKYGLPPAVYYHGADPAGHPMGQPQYIGRTTSRWRDDAGVWFRVVLDQANTYARRVWAAAQKRQAMASSGSIAHLVRYGRDGEILEWPGPVELSIFDIDPAAGRVPANAYAVAIPALKAIYQRAAMALPQGVVSVEDDEIQVPVIDQAAIDAAVARALAGERTRQQEEAQAAQRQQEAIDAAVKAARISWEAEGAADRRLPTGGGAPHVRQFAEVARYDDLSLEDQVFLIGMTNSVRGQRASEAAYKAAYIKAAEATKDSRAARQMHAAAKAAGFDLADAGNATKANELMHTTQVGFGDEWIGVGYSTRLWEVVRDPSRIAGMLPEIVIPQGSEGVFDPLEGADPVFYRVPETTDVDATSGRPNATIPASKAGTDRALHTASKVGGRVLYSGEMEENALIPLANELRRKLEVAAEEALEHVLIDGDTATAATTNINDIANAGTQGSTTLYLSFDGFRKLALVTNTSNSRDGGTLDEADFLETARLMGVAGLLGADVRKAMFIIDANVRWRVLQLAAIKTRDVFLNATIESGEFTAIWAYKVYTSYQMHRASAKRMSNANGKVHATDSNNTKGAILCVRPDQWKLARKRRVTIETSRWPESDANQIVLTMSAGLKPRDLEAAAISYNLTV